MAAWRVVRIRQPAMSVYAGGIGDVGEDKDVVQMPTTWLRCLQSRGARGNTQTLECFCHTASSFIRVADEAKDRHAEEGRFEADDQKVEENDESTSEKGSPSSDAAGNVSQITEVRQDDESPVISNTAARHRQQTTNQAVSVHKALWDKAYSNLKNDPEKAEYVSGYEELLAKVFLNQSTAEKAVRTNESSQHLGEEQMKKVVEEGLARIEKYKRAIEHSESTVNVIKQVKAILDIPLKNVSQTALPWAVISSSVDILLKPVSVGAALYNGVAYAISRIEWYSKLTNKLLCADSIKDEKSLHGIREDIAGRITSLYESLLFYQIKSVCFYYKKYQLLVWARGLLELDDWSGDLKHIQEAEDALARDCALFDMEYMKGQMKAMIMDTKTAEDSQEFQKRLQAIRRVDPQATVKTIESLKESVMDDLYTWIFDTEQFKDFMCWEENAPRRLWISGQAGTGKTMLSIGTIRELQTRGLRQPEPPTILYFFCQHTDADLNNGVAVLQSLVWMLLRQQPHLSSHLDEQFSHSGQKFMSDSNSFATWCDLLTSMLIDSARVVIAVDAVDECEEGSRKQLLRFLSGMIAKERMSHVKWFITSRPLLDIPDSRFETTLRYHTLLTLDDQNLNPWINSYIDRKAQALRNKAKNQERVQRIKDHLRERASNTYIWVSLVFEELENAPEARWQKIIEDTPRQLNELYTYLLRQLPWSECKTVLCVAMVARRPLSLWEIEQLTEMETGVNAGRDYVTECRSFLSIRGETVYFIHQSAQDWLLLNQHQLWDGSPQNAEVFKKSTHREILENSLKGMMETLKENIYQLPHYGVLSEEVETPSRDPLAAIRYSCQYWAYHLKEGELMTDIDMLGFLRQRFLHWLEALALMRIMPETVGIIDMLSSTPAMKSDSEIREFLLDAKRFVWRHQQSIMTAPLQVYVSALIFTPKASLVRDTGSIPKWIDQGPSLEEDWGPLLQTFPVSMRALFEKCSVSWSPDDQLIAGFPKGELRIWDAGTGKMVRKIDVEEDFRPELNGMLKKDVPPVTFTPDGQLLLALILHKVYIWDTATWEVSHIVECPDAIKRFAVSPNSQLLACFQIGGKIYLWQRNGNLWTLKWTYQSPLASPKYELLAPSGLSFSFDNRLLASTIHHNSIGFLDTELGQLQEEVVHEGVTAIKFFRDGKLLLQTVRTVEIWRQRDKWELDCKIDLRWSVNFLAVSPDGRFIALAQADSNIHVVETEEGVVVQTLGGHTDAVDDSAFSSDSQFLLSSGTDNRDHKSIKVWRIVPGKLHEAPLERHGRITRVALSADGSRFVTARFGGVIETWNGDTGEHQRTFEAPDDHRFFDVTVSPDNKLVAWLSYDGLLMVWNAETGQTIAMQWKRLPGRNGFAKVQSQFSSHSKLLGWVDHTGTVRNEPTMSEEVECSPEDCPSHNDVAHTPMITIIKDWVVLGEQRSIWLPPEYRPLHDKRWDAQSNVLIVAPESGSRPYSIRFNPHKMSAGQLQHDDAGKDSDVGYSSGLSLYSFNDEDESDGS
ncbi:NACHT and WD40 domain protein [Aspergillus eucalypticola CBS 122712]|uniref:NACHT and WD40 domain protein n=1 Tax=Aspergillus eucalypticola (strain CBS 122712 / IBT 29274) TaxID=1448314 RepID=A0A317WFN2_ASPEC|nr:NACHT and WD40 domain protein [Aspergillus eucalypticola CBS 122712]PWY84057.1 NACHT and WD40 domain protein [Aspergillus eucalypticola CBS 122712]